MTSLTLYDVTQQHDAYFNNTHERMTKVQQQKLNPPLPPPLLLLLLKFSSMTNIAIYIFQTVFDNKDEGKGNFGVDIPEIPDDEFDDLPEAGDKKSSKSNKRLSVERIYQKKTQLEHILIRPDSYIGSVETVTQVSTFFKLIFFDCSSKNKCGVRGQKHI